MFRIILKKGWISDFEILKICREVNCEEYNQEEHLTQIETQNTENLNSTEPNTTILMLI